MNKKFWLVPMIVVTMIGLGMLIKWLMEPAICGVGNEQSEAMMKRQGITVMNYAPCIRAKHLLQQAGIRIFD